MLQNAYKQNINSIPTARPSRSHILDSKKKIQPQKPTSNQAFSRYLDLIESF